MSLQVISLDFFMLVKNSLTYCMGCNGRWINCLAVVTLLYLSIFTRLCSIRIQATADIYCILGYAKETEGYIVGHFKLPGFLKIDLDKISNLERKCNKKKKKENLKRTKVRINS